MRVFNQFTEQWSVNQLAELVKEGGKKFGLDVQVGGCVWVWVWVWVWVCARARSCVAEPVEEGGGKN